jgi:hypothetical protein
VAVSLPYIEAVYLPDTIYAGEPFPLRFEQSAALAPDTLLGPCPPVPAGQVQYLSEPGHSGSIFILPWRYSQPPLTQARQRYVAPFLDYTMYAAEPGHYHLQYWGADSRRLGGLPTAQAFRGVFQDIGHGEAVPLWSVEFDVQPARCSDAQRWGSSWNGAGFDCRSYNEQVWACGPSCLDKPSCFGANGNNPPLTQLHHPRPQPKPQPPRPQPSPAHPLTVRPHQGPQPDPARVAITPATLSLPLP